MKTKLIIIALMSLLLVACDNPSMEYRQRDISTRALGALSTLKPGVVNYYSENKKCLNDVSKLAREGYYSFKMLENLSIFEVPNGCQVTATFKESKDTPNLSKESLSIKMEASNGDFYWTCSSTVKNKKYIPSYCEILN